MSDLSIVSRPPSDERNPSGARPKYLFERGRTFYFKRRIPADAAAAFPQYRGHLWKSLGTHLLERARLLLAVEVTEFEFVVAEYRRKSALHGVGIRDIGAGQPHDNGVASDRPADTPHPAGRKQGGLRSSQLTAPTAPPPMLERQPATPNAAKDSARQQVSSQPAGIKGPLQRPSMLHLFEDWKRKQDRPRTIAAVHTAVMEFRTLHGPLAVEDITKAHARDYRNHLVERMLSKGTIENRLGFLSALVRHGMLELVEDLARNPFERIAVLGAQRQRVAKDRRAYDVAELNTLYASKLYTAGYRPDGQAADAAYWLPILGPFVGARIEELAQLRVEDVQRVNGAWCIRVCDLGEDQKVKTTSSFRRVPLHRMVIEAGFLVYVAKIGAAGHDRVFPTLSNHNANHIYSNAVGKWYGRYLKVIGLNDHRLDYHSFRYTFRQQCSLSGIENETRDALTGHWVSNNEGGRTYMKAENRQYPYPKLVEAIKELRYEELKVGHLRVDDPYERVEEVLLR